MAPPFHPSRWQPDLSLVPWPILIDTTSSTSKYTCVCVCVWILRKTNSSDWRRAIGYKSWNEHKRDGSLLSFFQFTSLSLSLFLFPLFTRHVRDMSETCFVVKSIDLVSSSIFFLEGIYRFPINLSCEPLLIKINPFTCIYICDLYIGIEDRNRTILF